MDDSAKKDFFAIASDFWPVRLASRDFVALFSSHLGCASTTLHLIYLNPSLLISDDPWQSLLREQRM